MVVAIQVSEDEDSLLFMISYLIDMIISFINFNTFYVALGGMVYHFRLFTEEARYGLD